MFEQAEFREVYLEELEEQLQTLEEEILRLEKEGSGDEGIQRMFRAAHTLKGSSAAMGYEKMKSLTHEMEHYLDKARNRQASVHGEVIDVFFACLDRMRRLQVEIVEENREQSDIADLARRLETLQPVPADRPLSEAGEGAAPGLPGQDLRALLSKYGKDGNLTLVHIQLTPNSILRHARRMIMDIQLAAVGTVVWRDFHPQSEENDQAITGAKWVLLTGADEDSIRKWAASMMDVQRVELTALSADSRATKTADAAEAGPAAATIGETGAKAAAPRGVAAAKMGAGPSGATEAKAGAGPSGVADAKMSAAPSGATEEKTGASADSALKPAANTDAKPVQAPPAADSADKYKPNTVRVNVQRLEQLMNFVGELVMEQTRIHQVEKRFRHRYGAEELVDELGSISDHLSRIVGDLQESVMKARMLPIEQLFSRFPRMVRDLAQTLGKEVDLVLEGKETELDRTLIEEIGDPLIHLVRNAIDHGIESPAARRAAGKPGKGSVRIQAAHEDNQIVIVVADDGAGIDPHKLRRAAVAKGLLSEEQALQLPDCDAIHLIFHPGFSTAERLSDVSGRGVGMDIVRTDIERLNGLIAIETELGVGTAFKIKLPLTLAIITGLLVRIARETFILPMSSVAEIVRVAPASLRKLNGIPVMTLRDQIVPVIRLDELFGLHHAPSDRKSLPIVVIGRAEKRLAIAVDELIGNQEVVIKSLGSYIGSIEGVAGATILGDGSVALILDAGGLMRLARKHQLTTL